LQFPNRTLLIVARDISEQVKAKEAILRSKILLESSIESPKDMIILSLDHEYRYLYFNNTLTESMMHVYGSRPQMGDCIFDHIKIKEDIEKAKSHYDRALGGEGHSAIEKYGDGQLQFYYETQYNPIYDNKKEIIGVTAFAQNITERKQIEDKLKASEASLKTLIENVDGSIWAVDREYNLIESNSLYREHFSQASSKKISRGDNLLIGFPEDLKKEWQGHYDRAFQGETFIINTQSRFTSIPVNVQYRFNPIKTKDGKIIGTTVIRTNSETEEQK